MYFGMADSVHLPGTVPVGDLLPSGDAPATFRFRA